MVKNFDEFIGEGLWKSGVERAKTGEIRRENGVKIKTSLGIDVVVQNTDYDYEMLIKDILCGGDGGHPLDIDVDYLRNYGVKERGEVIRGEIPYAFILDKDSRDPLVALFGDFDEISETSTIFDGDNIVKEDYLAICEAISIALSKTDIDKGKPEGSQFSSTYFVLMGESETYNKCCEIQDIMGNDYDIFDWDDFRECFEDRFPTCEMVTWSYNHYGSAIGLEINYDNLINYFDCLEFVKGYFESALENAKEMREQDAED